MADGKYWLSHDAQDIDDTIDEVVAARGSEASLSARLAAQDDEIGAATAQGQSTYDFIFGIGTALNSNDDLNRYNAAGKIYAATGSIAATISNAPWAASGFMAITIPFISATSFIQFVLPNTVGGKWYRRRYTQGAWSPWIEYDGTQVSASQSASSASLMQAGRIDAELTDAGNDEEEER